MEMIGAIENMNLTLQIPDDSIAAEIARIDRCAMREGCPIPNVVSRARPYQAEP
jgi:hypothetical protein